MTFHYSATNPFMQIFNLQGTGLNDGDVYFGVAGQDPITNPKQVYWDADATIPASQPLETSGGYIVREGTPAAPYLEGPYSIKVLDKNGATVYYQAEVLDAVLDFINEVDSPAGAGKVGADHDETYPEGTLGEHYSHEIYATDAPWNASALLVVNNYTAIQAALDFAGLIGGKVILPAASVPYGISQGLVIPPSTELSGQGWFSGAYGIINNAATCIKHNGTGYAITLPTDFGTPNTGSGQIVRNLGIVGSASADGGICWGTSSTGTLSGNGLSTVENVVVTGFTKVGAAAFWFRECQRATVNNFAIAANNYTSIKVGSSCGFRLYNGNVSGNNVAGKAFDATSGGGGGVSAIVSEVYFESCPGQYPIDIRNGGNYWFIGGGYEAMCFADPTTITDPAVFNIVNPANVRIQPRDIDFLTSGDNLAGTLSFINSNSDAPALIFSAASISMNYAGAGRGGVTYDFFRGVGYYTNQDFSDTQLGGTGFASQLAMMQAYSPLVGTGFSSRHTKVSGWSFPSLTLPYVDYKTPYVMAVPNGQTGGTPPLVVTGTATGSYTFPNPYPKGWLGGTDELSIEVTGTRTGAVGAKTGSITLVCGTTITRDITAAATAADSWRATIGIYYIDSTHQRLLIDYHDGVTPPLVELLTQNQAANTLTISIGLDVATAAETMTVQTITMKRTR